MSLEFTEAEVNEAIRKTLNPYKVSLYQPAPDTGIVLTSSIDNKIDVIVQPPTGILPNGFDLFITDQGAAIRYIGSGLDNGDSSMLRVSMQLSLEATSSAALFLFKCKTRPYTEELFTNATDIEGCFSSADIAINKEGNYTIVAPLIIMNDGDLLELSIQPDTGVTININALAVTVIEEL